MSIGWGVFWRGSGLRDIPFLTLTFCCLREPVDLWALSSPTPSHLHWGGSETLSVGWWTAVSPGYEQSPSRSPAVSSRAPSLNVHPPAHQSPECTQHGQHLVTSSESSCLYEEVGWFAINRTYMWMLRMCIHCVKLTRSSSMLLAVSWRVVSSLLESSLTQSSRTEARSASTDAFSARADRSSSSSRDVARIREDAWASYACSALMCYTHKQGESSKEQTSEDHI